MKKIYHSFCFTAILLSTAAFTLADKWYLFESKTFGFKVEFPEKPTEKVKVVNTAQGDLNLNMFEYIAKKTTTEPALVYIVSYIEYPVSNIDSDNKEQLKEFYKTEADKLVTKLQGKLIKQTPISLEGHEGEELRIEIKDGTEFIKMRMYLLHHKFYMIETATETKNENNKFINTFMDSFRFVK